MAQHLSNPQTVTGEKAIANKVTDSVTLGDAKVKNLNAPLRAIAHNPTDTTPSVPPEVLELQSKVLELQS